MPSTPLILSDRLHDYAAFSDESHRDGNHTKMVIGGILLRSAIAHSFSAKITKAYTRFKFPETIQWKSINKRKLDAYKAVIDVIEAELASKRVDFGCIIFDQTKVDHKRHNESDPEKGFFKFLFQHHFKWHRHYKNCGTFRCFHGNMDTRYDLAEMIQCLNNSVRQPPPYMRRPYLQFEFIKVKETRCSQVADLLIGAAGFAANGGPQRYNGSAKHQIYDYMREAFCIADFSADTEWPDRGFHVWNFQL